MVRRNSGERLKRKVQARVTKSSAAGLRAFVLPCKKEARASTSSGTAFEERARFEALREDARCMLTMRARRVTCVQSRADATSRIAAQCPIDNREAVR